MYVPPALDASSPPPSLVDPAQTDLLPRDISRRASISGMAALAVPAIAGRQRPIQLGTRYVSHGRALSEFTGMIGACITSSTAAAPYGLRPQMVQALRDIGATWVRTKIFTGNKFQVSWLNELASNGIKVTALTHTPGGRDTPEQLVALVASSLASAVVRIEGPNEWNLQGGADWVPELVAYQTRLWNAAKANPATRNIDVVGPCLAFNEGFAELGDRSAIMDWGNIHLYPNGYVPSRKMDTKALPGVRLVCGSKPIIVTEAGWHNAENWHTNQFYTPEDVSGLYAPRLLLEWFIRNVTKVSFYELLDEPGARNPAERAFGLMQADFTPKPAYISLFNLNAILTRQYRTTGRPGERIGLSFRDGPSDLCSALVDRGDGRYLLFLWRSQASVYDPKNRIRLTVAPITTSIAWDTPRQVRRFEPFISADPLATEVTSLSSVALGAEVQILEVSPV